MATLSIPLPTLQFQGPTPNTTPLEKPVKLATAGARLPDGALFARAHLGSAGFLIYRQLNSTAAAEFWDEKAAAWRGNANPLAPDVKLAPLMFKEETAQWVGIFVAAGQPQFAPASGGFPRYSIRTVFQARTKEQEEPLVGLSAPTPPFQFVKLADSLKAGMKFGDDQTPENATEVTFFIKSGGQLGARITLLASGDVVIQPGPGGTIKLLGNVEAERILYEPFAGGFLGSKRWLTSP